MRSPTRRAPLRVVERVGDAGGGISLADAKVVVSAGRGAGSTRGLRRSSRSSPACSAAAVGCSRAVTMAGWRPHTDQVGQTGTKIAPDLYVACGISGATQHIAGCKGAKTILVINTDPEAPILASADYAVIGDLHDDRAGPLGGDPGGAGVKPDDPVRPGHGRCSPLALALVLALARRPLREARAPPLPHRPAGQARPPAAATCRRRLRAEATVVVGQRKLLQRLVPGLVHAFIFWGFVVLFPTIVLAFLGAIDGDLTLPWLGHQGWFFLLVDVFCVLVLVGVTAAFLIRKVQRPARFEGSHLGEADLILGLIALIVTTLLCWHGSRIALGSNEWPAGVVAGLERDRLAHGAGPVARGARAHLRLGARADDPRVPRLPAPLEAPPHRDRRDQRVVRADAGPRPARADRLRARGRGRPAARRRARVGDLTWKQMIDTMSCTECGRCQDVCPAWATGKALSPKLLIMDLRDRLFAEGPGLLRGEEGSPLVPGAVTDEVVWDCVTCGACVHECPVSIEHVDHIVDLRRQLVMVDARFPAEASTMLRDVERASNPWGKPQVERASWAEGLDVRVLQPGDPPPEILYWVGCAASFDERARATARATASLLLAAGSRRRDPRPAGGLHGRPVAADGRRVHLPGTGPVERRDARRERGHEDRHELPALLQHASATSTRTSAARTRSSTTRSFSRSSSARAGSSRWPAPSRSPTTTRATSRVTTTCSLRRASSSRASADRSRWRAAASEPSAAAPAARTCGWRSAGRAINEERAREAAATGAGTLAVACPFCTMMLDDGVKQTGSDLRVADVAVLLAEALPDSGRALTTLVLHQHKRCLATERGRPRAPAAASSAVWIAVSVYQMPR